jgi:hypothetical protein
MSLDNLSAVLYGKGDLRLEQTAIPDPPQKNGNYPLYLSCFIFEQC